MRFTNPGLVRGKGERDPETRPDAARRFLRQRAGDARGPRPLVGHQPAAGGRVLKGLGTRSTR